MLDARRTLLGPFLLLTIPAVLAGCSLGKGDGIVIATPGDGATAGGDMEPSPEWDGCDGCSGGEPEAEPPPDWTPGDDAVPDEGGDYVDDGDDYSDDSF